MFSNPKKRSIRGAVQKSRSHVPQLGLESFVPSDNRPHRHQRILVHRPRRNKTRNEVEQMFYDLFREVARIGHPGRYHHSTVPVPWIGKGWGDLGQGFDRDS